MDYKYFIVKQGEDNKYPLIGLEKKWTFSSAFSIHIF